LSDQRSLVITVISMFLALGLGLLIGGTMLGEGAMVSQQRGVISRLEVDTARLSEENKLFGARLIAAENALRVYREFGRRALPRLIDGRLAGRSVAVVVLDNGALIDEPLAAIRRAGAEIASLTTVVDGLDLRPAERRRAIADYVGPAAASLTDLTGRAADLLAGALAEADLDDLAFLEEAGLIRRSGAYVRPARLVLVVGGDHDGGRNTATVDDRLLTGLAGRGVRVVLAERSDVEVSTVEVGQRRGIPTVDNLETAPGQAAAVYALAGEAGDYGQKATAREVVPQLGQ
jgi:hypothetical protein